jgi:hypothetical protein
MENPNEFCDAYVIANNCYWPSAVSTWQQYKEGNVNRSNFDQILFTLGTLPPTNSSSFVLHIPAHLKLDTALEFCLKHPTLMETQTFIKLIDGVASAEEVIEFYKVLRVPVNVATLVVAASDNGLPGQSKDGRKPEAKAEEEEG